MGDPRAILDQMIPTLASGNMDAFADLFHEDGIQEIPFAPSGGPREIAGREKIRSYLSSLNVPLDFNEFEEVCVRRTDDPEVIVAEYDAKGAVRTTGETFC